MPYQGGNNRGGGFRREGSYNDRPSFGPRRSFGGGDRGGAPGGMHPAVCSDCGDNCEVPFRPTGERPIFCGKCFGAKKGDFDGSRAPKRDFDRPAPRPSYGEDRPARPSAPAADNGAMTRELQNVNGKLDQLIRAVETLASALNPKKESKKAVAEVAEVIAEVTEAKPKKAAAKKKKA